MSAQALHDISNVLVEDVDEAAQPSKKRAPRQKSGPRRRLSGSRKPAAAQEGSCDGICDVSLGSSHA